MIKLKIFTFLLGTMAISCKMFKTSRSHTNPIVFGRPRYFPMKHFERLPSHNPFIQQGANLFYKPHFVMPQTHIPTPFVSENMNQGSGFLPYALQNTPGIYMSQPININEFPEDKAQIFYDTECEEPAVGLTEEEINRPSPEYHVLTEEGFNHEQTIQEEQTPALISVIPETPAFPAFIVPENPEIIEFAPDQPCDDIEIEKTETFLELPAAPELLPLPEIPITMIETPEPAPIVIEKIPEAPELSTFVMPELPKIEELIIPTVPETPIPCEHIQAADLHIPPAPEFPSVLEVSAPEIVETHEIIEEIIPEMPIAPVLPTFVMPELPSLETLTAPELFPSIFVTPDEENKQEEQVELVEIPEAPVLSPLPLLETPVEIVHSEPEVPLEAIEIIKVPENPEPTIFETSIISEPTVVEVLPEPKPTEMKPIELKGESVPMIQHPMHYPGFLPGPVFYAQNIIIERVVPNMIINSEKIPVNTLPYFTNQAVPIIDDRDCN